MAKRLTGRLDGLDGLRGIAAMSVLLYHYTAWLWNARAVGLLGGGPVFLFPYGALGVDLFFIISGFVIVMTLQRTASVYQFAMARFARLYPAFLVSLLVTLAVTAALRRHLTGINVTAFLANLTMAPELLGKPCIDGSYWTLAYELTFYLLAAVACLALRWRSLELPCAAMLGVELLLRAILTAPPATFANLFVIGIMLYRWYAGQSTRLTAPVLFAALAMAMLGREGEFPPISPAAYAFCVGGFALLVWIATTTHGAFLSIPPLRFLGRISYPLYLVHQTAGAAVLAELTVNGVGSATALVVTAALAIMLGWAISSHVEWPAQRWLRSRLIISAAARRAQAAM